MASIVIAAHNEAAVIERCLDAVLAATNPGEFDVTVVANGCSDNTARLAAARGGVRVLELPAAGKVAALNAGDDVAVGYPRIYLDADIVVSADDIRALCDALAARDATRCAPPLAVTAKRQVDVSRSPRPVRAYYAINARLPVFKNALIGRGVIALSAEGRSRFDRFPDVMADDLFLDSIFADAEKREVDAVATVVAAPRRTTDLVRRLARVRRGNASLRAALPARRDSRGAGRRRGRMSWLTDVVLRDPVLAPAALWYVTITLVAVILAKRSPQGTAWGRDNSTRQDVHGAGRRQLTAGHG